MDNSGNVGVAWYVMGACEFVGTCGTFPTLAVYADNNYVISGAEPSDTITLLLYWNTQYNYFVFDYKDPNAPPPPGWQSCPQCYWTVEDFSNYPSVAEQNFKFGVDQSCPALDGLFQCNPPYDDSYGYQMGVSTNSLVLDASWTVELSNPTTQDQGEGTVSVAHVSTIGQEGQTTDGSCDLSPCVYAQTDAYWHDNWSWGAGEAILIGASYQFQDITVVSATPIEYLNSGQVNGQEFTAGAGGSSPECVTVTNFAAIVNDIEEGGGGELGAQLGPWISGHPFANGLWWTVDSSGSCPYLTYTYASGYQVPDNTQLW